MATVGMQRLHLMLLSLICNPSRERRRDVRNSRNGKVGILVMADARSQCDPRSEMVQGTGREIGLELDREVGLDMGMGRRVRSRGRSIRCGLRRRPDIYRSGWPSTRISL